jgi:hypothetical protein
MTSPTQLSLAYLKKKGYTTCVAERWNPFACRRVDLFGFVDIVALTPLGILGVQTTSAGHISDRAKKIQENEYFPKWKEAGGQVVIHGWKKKGSRWEVKEKVL